MSVKISNSESISRSPINNSPSKQLYTFARTKRFQVPSPYHSRISYEAKSEFGQSKYLLQVPTTFGVARPQLFYSKENLSKPSPDQYTLSTAFTTNYSTLDAANN